MNVHNPGGSVSYPIGDGIYGSAVFAGERQEHRLLLTRSVDERRVDRDFVLLIGANPSTANHDKNDPTVGREWRFTLSWGHRSMVKANVMTYRATFPKDLLTPNVQPSIPDNLPMIRDYASRAALIVCCWGAIHYKLKRYAAEVEDALRKDGRTLHCFGLTKAGMPRHPLYLASDTPLVEF